MIDHECEFFLMNNIAAHVCECGNVIIGYNGTVGIEYVEKTKYDDLIKERDSWIAEYRSARAEIEQIKIQYDAEFEAFKMSFRNRSIRRLNMLEEWITEYRDHLKKENVYHKNQGIINAINELLDEVSTDSQ